MEFNGRQLLERCITPVLIKIKQGEGQCLVCFKCKRDKAVTVLTVDCIVEGVAVIPAEILADLHVDGYKSLCVIKYGSSLQTAVSAVGSHINVAVIAVALKLHIDEITKVGIVVGGVEIRAVHLQGVGAS